jgi:hypothetical protein
VTTIIDSPPPLSHPFFDPTRIALPSRIDEKSAPHPGLGWYSLRVIIVRDPIPLSELTALAKAGFGDFVKAVVDVERLIQE